jgi:L-cysteine:1D-myo-inositol 2-amino-2-deoxy-alpha-D-glucopyranoside ligase
VQAWPEPNVPPLDRTMPPFRLTNTASGTVELTTPATVARMYVCGITPYDATHLGHAATYLTFDLVHRYWRAAGHRVNYVQNVTDVDDPLLERAARDGVDWAELAAWQTDLFRSDMTALGILPPTSFVGAVEAMEEVTDGVKRLLDSGAAYRVTDTDNPDVYFDVGFTGRFGYESGYDGARMRTLSAERGGDPDRPGKRNPLDPLLWRMERPGEPAWESAMGRGRPGWHIECAVMAVGRLGATIDVQGGGSDLIFPHHECSAAHAEALTGEHPFARHYVHTGMMELDGEKMSKSRGNLEFVSRLTAAGTDPMAIRTALLAHHYHGDHAWSMRELARAENRLAAWRSAAGRTGAAPETAITELVAALADDLDTRRALRAVDAWAADPLLAGQPMMRALDALLGVGL